MQMRDVVMELAKREKIPIALARHIVHTVCQCIVRGLEQDETVSFSTYFSLELKTSKGHRYTDYRTKTKKVCGPFKVLRVHPRKFMKKMLDAKKLELRKKGD